MARVGDQRSVLVKEGEVHPRYPPDARQLSTFRTAAQPLVHLVHYPEHVPVQAVRHAYRHVRKTMDLPEIHALAVEATEKYPPALRPDVHREEVSSLAHRSTG